MPDTLTDAEMAGTLALMSNGGETPPMLTLDEMREIMAGLPSIPTGLAFPESLAPVLERMARENGWTVSTSDLRLFGYLYALPVYLFPSADSGRYRVAYGSEGGRALQKLADLGVMRLWGWLSTHTTGAPDA